MQHWHDEYNAEHQRQRILKEVEQIRLENLTRRARVYHPRFFARTMFNFANWMISTGKTLRSRYEIPAVNCSKTQSFAQ